MLIADILGQHGPFTRHVKKFVPRVQQQEMAQAVAECLDDHGVLIAEAGTGTGKTFAYLVPALMSGKTLIISTGTKNLQDQLYNRDLPLVRKALGIPARTALLKGRSNYLCHHRLGINSRSARLGTRQQALEFQQISRWAQSTRSGDIAEVSGVAEHSPVWPLVTSTADNCLGKECPEFSRCHVLQARRQAQEADILVVNHHLYFADLALREDGFGELLPGAHGVIFDEAHLLPEVASRFFGLSLSAGQLVELATDSTAACLSEASDMPQLERASEALQQAVREFRLQLGEAGQRTAWQRIAGRRECMQALEQLASALQGLATALEPAAPRGKALEQCAARARGLHEKLALLTAANDEDHVHWLETYRRSFSLYLTPLTVADRFREHLHAHPGSWVFTSATLAVQGDFGHFARALGVEQAHTHCWNSPFDYAAQSLLYLPPELPDPATPAYNAALIKAVTPVLAASRGRAFLLTTSYRALQEYAAMLEQTVDYPVLVQGTLPRPQLLSRFTELGNAILVGTSSFWEGVDVRGEALSCVIIDRLPFASPGDPVLSARIDALRRQGGNPFRDYQLPQAVIELKQGAGRLIRDIHDRGVLVLCDPRLSTRSYGTVFMKSLPEMPLTRQLQEVVDFFDSEHSENPSELSAGRR